MIHIRPGRSWRLNPGYLRDLRALTAPRARAFDGGGILDVLGIEVDGVDIAAGVGEAEVLVAVDELLAALRHLADGSPAAQATVGRGPTELVLEARGADVRLALVSLAPPARMLASGLLLDGARLRAAAAAAARALAEDLVGISPVLAEAPLLRRLGKGQAASRRRTRPPAWPQPGGRAFVARGARGQARCEVQVSEDAAARLSARAEVPDAPLAPLLGAGAVVLRFPGAPALSWEGPVYLALRNLVRDAAALVQAWEAGDPTYPLPFGAAEVSCDLTRDEAHAAGWRRPVSVSPPSLALALALAARAYADKALRLAPRRPQDDLLRDLRSASARLAAHCTDLASGDLRRSPDAVAAPPPHKAPRPRPAPLSAGRLRRIVYREAWRVDADERPALLWLLPGAVVTLGRDEAVVREISAGRVVFREPCIGLSRAHAGDDLLLASLEGLVRLDPLSGAARWRRRMRGGAELWAVPGGFLRASATDLARISDVGTVAFRVRPPGGAPSHVAHGEGVLACGAPRLLCGLDASDGRLLWKRRAQAHAVAAAPGRLLALCAARVAEALLLAVEPQTGRVLWERPLPDGAEGVLAVTNDAALSLSQEPHRKLTAARLTDGTLLFSSQLPFPGAADLAAGEEPDDVILVTGKGGAAARIDARGGIAWSLEAIDDSPLVEAPLLRRGVALLSRGGAVLHDAASGLELARLSSEPPALAALGEDLSTALIDEAGALSLHRLATHLSLV